jgi:hypothetical protein
MVIRLRGANTGKFSAAHGVEISGNAEENSTAAPTGGLRPNAAWIREKWSPNFEARPPRESSKSPSRERLARV